MPSTRSFLRASAVTAVVVLAGLTGTAPACAHAGPNAVPLVRDFTLTPTAGGWTASVTVADFDSGRALRAVDVSLAGAGLAKPAAMLESATPGTYALALPRAVAGPVHLELRMRTLPGGTPVTPFNETYDRTLVGGRPLHVAGSAPTGGGGGSSAGLIAGVVGAAVVAAGGAAVAVRRRRPAPAVQGR